MINSFAVATASVVPHKPELHRPSLEALKKTLTLKRKGCATRKMEGREGGGLPQVTCNTVNSQGKVGRVEAMLRNTSAGRRESSGYLNGYNPYRIF